MMQHKSIWLLVGFWVLVTASACGTAKSTDGGASVEDTAIGGSDATTAGTDATTQDTAVQDNGPDSVDSGGSDVQVQPDTVVGDAGDVTASEVAACDPASETDCDDGNPCTDDTCVNGACKHGNNEAPCSLADACSVGGCKAGACVVSHAKSCDDGDPCTTDSCNSTSGCKSAPASGVPCDDGDVCTVNDACVAGQCTGGGALACDDGNVCTNDSCADGCVYTANAATCTDNDACTQGDTCANSACAAGSPVDCSDGITCTVESCVWSQGCVGGPQDNLCNDANGCTTDTCDPTKGCVFTVLDQSTCDDNNACTSGEKCVGQVCTPPSAKPCDDNDACTDNLCDPVQGCTFPAAVTPCDDGNPCTADYCDTTKGCAVQPAFDGTPCDDGNAETMIDSCAAGKCVGKVVALIPAGSFYMGCVSSDPNCSDSENPGHLVELDGFYIDTKEVTIQQLKGCVDAGLCKFIPGAPGCSGEKPIADFTKTVTCVDWTDATAYCNWVGGRLPTEAEWEKAARGGCELYPAGQCATASRIFPWGNEAPTCSLANGNDPTSGQDCVGGATAPGLIAAGKSPYGLYDAAGNAAEWVADFYDPAYYTFTPFGGWKNPAGPDSSPYSAHGIRGGGYKSNFYTLRVSSRNFSDGALMNSGIRCAYDKK